MKSNLYQTNDEMAEIAESIITGRPLQEDMISELSVFLQNYQGMKDILANLQEYLKDYARNNQGNKIMGQGQFTKAFNASRKVDQQLNRMNQDAKEFISLMREVIQ